MCAVVVSAVYVYFVVHPASFIPFPVYSRVLRMGVLQLDLEITNYILVSKISYFMGKNGKKSLSNLYRSYERASDQLMRVFGPCKVVGHFIYLTQFSWRSWISRRWVRKLMN